MGGEGVANRSISNCKCCFQFCLMQRKQIHNLPVCISSALFHCMNPYIVEWRNPFILDFHMDPAWICFGWQFDSLSNCQPRLNQHGCHRLTFVLVPLWFRGRFWNRCPDELEHGCPGWIGPPYSSKQPKKRSPFLGFAWNICYKCRVHRAQWKVFLKVKKIICSVTFHCSTHHCLLGDTFSLAVALWNFWATAFRYTVRSFNYHNQT